MVEGSIDIDRVLRGQVVDHVEPYLILEVKLLSLDVLLEWVAYKVTETEPMVDIQIHFPVWV